MENENRKWDQFNRIKLDRKQFRRRIKKVETVSQRHAHRFILTRIDNIKAVSREVTIWLLLIGGIIAAIGIQLLWGQQMYTMQSPSKHGTYSEGVLGPVNTLNPLYISSSAEASAARLTFSSLYSYDDTGHVAQDLATSMTIDGSGKVYTVTIRDDVKWHDDTKLTAEDVVYTINLIRNPAVRSPLRVNWLDVQAKALNQKTIEFTLPAAYAAFPYALTFSIIPKHIVGSISPGALRESAFSRNPIGSGPFKFRRLQPADTVSKHDTVHLIANEQYYRGAPKLDRFELHAYETSDAIVAAVRASEVTGASDISVVSANAIPNTEYATSYLPLDSGVYTLFNNVNPILQDKSVRKALQLATDTEAIRKKIGNVKRLDLPILSSHVDGVLPTQPAVDIAKANEALEAAGWKQSGSSRVKNDKKLELTITVPNKKEYSIIADEIAKQWQVVGIKVNKKSVDPSSVSSNFIQDILQGRNFDILIYELIIGADPDVFAYWHSSQVGLNGYNFASYSDKTADASLAGARARLEPALRNAKYIQFAKQWIEDAPAIALYQPIMVYATNKNASSIQSNVSITSGADRYANVLQWTVEEKSVYRTP